MEGGCTRKRPPSISRERPSSDGTNDGRRVRRPGYQTRRIGLKRTTTPGGEMRVFWAVFRGQSVLAMKQLPWSALSLNRASVCC